MNPYPPEYDDPSCRENNTFLTCEPDTNGHEAIGVAVIIRRLGIHL